MFKIKSVWSVIDRKIDGFCILVIRFCGCGMLMMRYDVWMFSFGLSELIL